MEKIIKKINKLSEEQVDKLLELMDVGIPDDLDKDEKIMIVATEPEDKINEGLNKLKEKENA